MFLYLWRLFSKKFFFRFQANDQNRNETLLVKFMDSFKHCIQILQLCQLIGCALVLASGYVEFIEDSLFGLLLLFPICRRY